MGIEPGEKKAGYTCDDFAVRCKYCSIGTDQYGGNIGAPLAAYTVSCQLESGSIAVAEFARCINMGGFRDDESKREPCENIYNLKLLPIAFEYGLKKENILRCLKHSRGNFFTLKELQAGGISVLLIPKEITAPPPDFNESAEAYSENIPF
jgi:hypothetical protein